MKPYKFLSIPFIFIILLFFYFSDIHKGINIKNHNEKIRTNEFNGKSTTPTNHSNQAFSKFFLSSPNSESAYHALDEIRKQASHLGDYPEKLRNIIFDTSRAAPERATAVRIYADLIINGAPTDLKHSIRRDLVEIIQHSDEYEIGRAATFSYTRSLSNLDESKNFLEILETGLKQGFLNQDEYSGELVHRAFVFKSIPDDFMNMISHDHNPHGRMVLYNYLSNQDIVEENLRNSNPQISLKLNEIVKNEIPKFSGHPFSYGLSEAVQFHEWAKSYANIQSATAPGRDIAYTNSIIQVFGNEKIDPRGLIALLHSPDSELIYTASRAGDIDARRGMARVRSFLSDYEGIDSLQFVRDDLSGMLN